MSDFAIQASELVREFKNGPRAVDGIDLGVEPGEIYGFLGPNGAGKSTTVHMLTTLLPPTSGSARVAGHDVVSEGPKVRAAIRFLRRGGEEAVITTPQLVYASLQGTVSDLEGVTGTRIVRVKPLVATSRYFFGIGTTLTAGRSASSIPLSGPGRDPGPPSSMII